MLCVWGKKKLELEQRQQLGGGGAQSIKVLFWIGQLYWQLMIYFEFYNLTEEIYFCQVLKDQLLVAVSEYILVLDHSCQVTQGPSDGHLWSAPGVDQVEAIWKRSTLLCRLWWTLGGRWSCQASTKKYAPEISRGLKLTFSGDCLSGTCTLVTASGLSDKAPFPTWFLFFFRSCPDEHWYRTQVLDYPHCWALGSGGRGAVWDLSAGKIVSYFGSNDRCSPNYSCFDNFSYYIYSSSTTGGSGNLPRMVGQYQLSHIIFSFKPAEMCTFPIYNMFF